MLRLTHLCAILIILIGLAFGVSCGQAADLKFPELTGRIIDQAHVLQPQTISALDEKLAAFEQQTSHQVVVVTLNDIGDYDIADYGYQLGRHWQIGQQGKNDGVIVLMVPSTKQVRIDVGYGLEGDLTDATSSMIISNVMIPQFKQGDLETGLVQGTLAVMSVISQDGSPLVKQAQGQTADSQMKYFLIALLIFWVISRLFGGRSSGSGIAPFLLGSMLGGGGGGGGGFSGGGGSFGGGGASGRW